MDESQGRTTPTAPAFVFPATWEDQRLYPVLVSAENPHSNSPASEYTDPQSREAQLVTAIGAQPNVGNFKCPVFHADFLLENVDETQLQDIQARHEEVLILVTF